jgi:hypothetical protein
VLAFASAGRGDEGRYYRDFDARSRPCAIAKRSDLRFVGLATLDAMVAQHSRRGRDSSSTAGLI